MSSNGLSQCNVARDAASQALHLKLAYSAENLFLHISCCFYPHESLPSGKHTKNYGKSPFLMGKSTISTGPAIQVRFFYVYQAGCQLYQFHPPRNITIPMRWTIQWLGFFKGKLKPESPIFNGNIYGFHTNQMLFTIFNGY